MHATQKQRKPWTEEQKRRHIEGCRNYQTIREELVLTKDLVSACKALGKRHGCDFFTAKAALLGGLQTAVDQNITDIPTILREAERRFSV